MTPDFGDATTSWYVTRHHPSGVSASLLPGVPLLWLLPAAARKGAGHGDTGEIGGYPPSDRERFMETART
jgi:hypothetical protein